jgi:hypothetical protein
MNCK